MQLAIADWAIVDWELTRASHQQSQIDNHQRIEIRRINDQQ
jgi:hypothetical protein